MSLQEEYKLKIETEIKPAQDKLVELRAHSDKRMTEANIKYAEPIEELEDMAHTMMIKLTDLGNVGDDLWEGLRGDVEIAVEAFLTAIKNTTEKFEADRSAL